MPRPEPTASSEELAWLTQTPEGAGLPDLLGRALHHFDGALEVLEKAYVELVKAKPVRRDHAPYHAWVWQMAQVVDRIEGVQDKLKEVRAAAGEEMCRALPVGVTLVAFPETRPMTPRWGGDRNGWKNDLLQEDVKPRLLMKLDEDGQPTGELRDPQDVLDTTLSVVSLIGNNVKTTGLKKLGINADDYCHKTPTPPDVQVTK